MESVIRLENFYFAYNKSELVLQDIDLRSKGFVHCGGWPQRRGQTTLCKAMTASCLLYGRALQRRCAGVGRID
ncbi:MAG: hypothetical protein ACLRXQ_04105 [Phascolarctobacterium faecium]